jgi:FlaA1/EpsC-like NDP-sugar epimerase
MPKSLKKSLQSKSRAKKRLILVVLDALIIPIILFACFSLRYKNIYSPAENSAWLIFPLATLIALPVFLRLGLYRAVLQHFRSQAILITILATLLSTVIWVGVVNLLHLAEIPASVALLYWLATSTLIIVMRLLAQGWLYGPLSKSMTGKKVFIYGAGMAGSQLAKVIESDSDYSLLGFIDDDVNLKGMNILGSKVYSSDQFNKLANKTMIDEVILAMPSLGRRKRQGILKSLEGLPITIRSVPSFSDLASGKLSTSDIKEIDIDDLLGR